jgi:hypothetical protein
MKLKKRGDEIKQKSPGIFSDLLTFKIVPFSHIFKASDGFWKTVRPIMFFEKSTD